MQNVKFGVTMLDQYDYPNFKREVKRALMEGYAAGKRLRSEQAEEGRAKARKQEATDVASSSKQGSVPNDQASPWQGLGTTPPRRSQQGSVSPFDHGKVSPFDHGKASPFDRATKGKRGVVLSPRRNTNPQPPWRATTTQQASSSQHDSNSPCAANIPRWTELHDAMNNGYVEATAALLKRPDARQMAETRAPCGSALEMSLPIHILAHRGTVLYLLFSQIAVVANSVSHPSTVQSCIASSAEV